MASAVITPFLALTQFFDSKFQLRLKIKSFDIITDYANNNKKLNGI